jgi:pimeloyl-ACP methyl ester carboxylesterase
MGGQIAIHLALMPDVALSQLILIAPAGFETFTIQDKLWINNMFRPDLLKSITYEQLVKNFDINFYRFPEDARFMISDRLRMQESNILFDQYCAMIPSCVRGMLDQPVFHRLNEIRQPVLILFGENDQLIPIRHLHPGWSPSTVAQAGAAQLRHSQLVLFQACGHFVPWEQSEKANSEIQRFVG